MTAMAADDIDREFMAIASEQFFEPQVNAVLDSFLARSREWIRLREADGKPADLRHFTSQILHEPSDKRVVCGALGAALWRLMNIEDAAAAAEGEK